MCRMQQGIVAPPRLGCSTHGCSHQRRTWCSCPIPRRMWDRRHTCCMYHSSLGRTSHPDLASTIHRCRRRVRRRRSRRTPGRRTGRPGSWLEISPTYWGWPPAVAVIGQRRGIQAVRRFRMQPGIVAPPRLGCSTDGCSHQ
eukprot:scaffold3319_cov427-Prasinococcus_capsulatus_cf.AAC.30